MLSLRLFDTPDSNGRSEFMTMSHYSSLSSGSSNPHHSGKASGKHPGGGNKSRWYDHVPELRQAIFLMEALPHSIQVVMSQLISVSLRQDSRQKMNSGQLRQYGAEKILGLMKSRAKNRWYDQEANIHKAFNDIYLSEDSKWRDTSLRIIVSIAQLQRAGLATLGEKQAAAVIFEVFHCSKQSLYQKAQDSLELLALPETAPKLTGNHDLHVSPLLDDSTQQVRPKTPSRSISKGGDRLMIDELRQMRQQ